MVQKLHPFWRPLLRAVAPGSSPFRFAPRVPNRHHTTERVNIQQPCTHLTRISFSPFTSRASRMEYACIATTPLRSPSPQPPCQLSNTPVEQLNRNSLLTFMTSSAQNFSVSRISVVNSSVVTPPVRSSIASLQAVNARQQA